MSSIDELRQSLTSDLEKSIDKVNLKADDILSKTDDLTNPRYWYNSNYPHQMVHVMTRSAGNFAPNHTRNDDDRTTFSAEEQGYQHLDSLDKEFRKAHQQKVGQPRKKGKHGRKGKLAWKRRKTWHSGKLNSGPKPIKSHDIAVKVVNVTESATKNFEAPATPFTENDHFRPDGEFLNLEDGLPPFVSMEMEQYRISKSQGKERQFDTPDVLEAYNRKPSEKVDTLPSIHKSFMPREQRTNKHGNHGAHAPEEEEMIFPSIEINTRKSDEFHENLGKTKPRRRINYRLGPKEETERVQLPMIDDLVRVRELRKTDPSDLNASDQRKREYVEGWIRRLNKGNSGKTRAKTKKFQSELQRNFDPDLYKTVNEHSEQEHIGLNSQQNMNSSKDCLSDLPEKYPELVPNDKPSAGMYFHTLRQKSVYSLSLNQMNNQLKRYRQKGQHRPRSLSSGSVASDFNAKIAKVENKIDGIGSEIGKLYQSTSSLHKIVNRETPRSKSEDISSQGDKRDLVIEATPVKVSPTKTDVIEESEVNVEATEEDVKKCEPENDHVMDVADDSQSKHGVNNDDVAINGTKEEVANEDRESTKHVYAKSGLVPRETLDRNKLSVVNLEMARAAPPDGENRSKSSVLSMASTINKDDDDLGDEESSLQAAERLLDKNLYKPGSPFKEPMKKFNKLEPFNERERELENDNKKRNAASRKSAQTGEMEEKTAKCDEERQKNDENEQHTSAVEEQGVDMKDSVNSGDKQVQNKRESSATNGENREGNDATGVNEQQTETAANDEKDVEIKDTTSNTKSETESSPPVEDTDKNKSTEPDKDNDATVDDKVNDVIETKCQDGS